MIVANGRKYSSVTGALMVSAVHGSFVQDLHLS